MTHLDLIIPCFNPAPSWKEDLLLGLGRFRKALPDVQVELIFVNDGAGTEVGEAARSIAESLKPWTYIELSRNCGKGRAVRTGAEQSNARHCMFTDLDFPYSLDSMVALARALLNNEGEILIAQRDPSYYRELPLMRRWISKTLQRLVGFVLGLKYTETQAGLKGFNTRGKALLLETRIDRYLFDLELILKASRRKDLHIRPVPARLREGVSFSSIPLPVLVGEMLNFIRVALKG